MSLIEDREECFAAFVIETLTRREAELARRWADGTTLGSLASTETSDGDGTESYVPGRLVRAVLAASNSDDASSYDTVARVGRNIGATAQRHAVHLHQLLEDLDRLEEILLRDAARAATSAGGTGTLSSAFTVARRICRAVSSLRRASARAYADAVEVDLRERYRAIRHDLRNPLGTIKSAIALLADDTVPSEMRQSSRVRAMVARNTDTLDRMIGDVLGDDAARLVASGDGGVTRGASGREQLDDLPRVRQRADLETGDL